jgi:hypothetical protein
VKHELILDRFPGDLAAEAGPPADGDAVDKRGCFGLMRGTRDRAMMIELRKKSGNILALGYAWLSKATFDASEGITLTFGSETVRIRGRNLNAELRPTVRLFECITRHKVAWLQEADEPASMEAGERETVIDSIEW